MLLKSVTSIVVPKNRLRELEEDAVISMMQSIQKVGVLQPILVNGSTLLAGHHRLEACRRLGLQDIPCLPVGDINDKDLNQLIEIEENLIRKPLSVAEKANHLRLRTDILAKRLKPEKRKEVAARKVKQDRLTQEAADEVLEKTSEFISENTNLVKLSSRQQAVITGGDAAAVAEVIRDTAEILQKTPNHVQSLVTNAAAVEAVGLPMEDMKKLNCTQYKQVAKVAKKGDKEAARAELKEQLKGKTHNNGQKVSVVTHDSVAYLDNQIKYVRDQATRLRSPSLFKHIALSDLEQMYFKECIESLEEVTQVLKKKQKEIKELTTESK